MLQEKTGAAFSTVCDSGRSQSPLVRTGEFTPGAVHGFGLRLFSMRKNDGREGAAWSQLLRGRWIAGDKT